MKWAYKILIAALFASFCMASNAGDREFPRKEIIPRKDAFFGMHFDLHPNKSDTALGADVSEANIEKLLRRTQPDYVQYDCKGHAGYAGYPTKVGTPAPGIVKDSLAIWRKITKQFGVGLYIHYSGVWDSAAIEKHPDWARIDENGNQDRNNTSAFGPYVDELLIPQLKEVTSKYELDGLWVDGECWAAKLDYSPAALESWKKETGFEAAPKNKKEPHWLEWKTFHRNQFEKYLSHWVDALHEFNPKLQITSNWMYSSFAPLPVKAKLDFLSGDYSPGLSVDKARLEARYLASTGMPWDLMAWGFDKCEGLNWSFKTPIHLQQEAAAVLMQGGGFQIYNQPTRSGYIVDDIIDTYGEVADFCRARQKVSHKSQSVPQVALLLSSESHWEESDSVFAPWGGEFNGLEGALHALLELQYSVDILAEHQLQPRLSEYPLVVVPDSPKLTDDFKQALIDYVKGGGSLFLMGEKCARLFKDVLGVDFVGDPRDANTELKTPGGVVNVQGVWQDVKPTTAEIVGYRYPTRDVRKDGQAAASLVSLGKGKIAAVYGPLPNIFFRCHHPSLRRFVGAITERLFPEPAVAIDGPPCVDISLRKTKDGQLSLHLMNCANLPRSNRFPIIDYIPEIGPITVKMRVPAPPSKIRWIPNEENLKSSWDNGVLTVVVPKLHIHGVLVLES